MKKSRTLSLFKVSIILLINIFLLNKYLLIISIVYLLISNKKETILFIFLFIFIYNFNNYFNDYIKYGYIENIYSDYAVINKILYKSKTYDIDNLEVGYIVKTNDSNINNNIDDYKYGILYINNDLSIVYKNTLINKNFSKTSNSNNKQLFTKILFNDYVNEYEFEYSLGYGLSLYYLLLFVFNKNINLSIIIMFLYIVLFGFEIKFLLFMIDYIISFKNKKSLNNVSIKIILFLLINKYYLLNYSILITLIFNLLNYFNMNKKYIIAILQSLFFGQISLIITLFFKQYIKLKVLIFILVLIMFYFPVTTNVILHLISIISNLIEFTSFSIRGKVSFVSLIIFYLLSKTKYFINDYIKSILLILLIISPINNPFKTVTFINVGQGDSILLKGELKKYNVLIDTGSKYNYSKLKRYLINEGIYNIDYLIITHNDEDHNGNIELLQKDFYIKEIINSKKNIKLEELNLINIDLGNFENDNDNSLIYKANINGYNFIFTGDISKNVERLLTKEIDSIDVLKVSHHGSKTATSRYFISKILPKIAVISTNGKYNHPSNEVLETLNSFYVKTYITKNDGNITFYFTDIVDFIKTDNYHFDIIKP